MGKKQDESNWSQWLKRQRALHGLTQQELAQKIGTTALTISRWERGLATPRSYSIRQLLTLFGSNKEEFAGETMPGDDDKGGIPASFAYDPSIPPPPTAGLVGRTEILHKVEAWLCSHAVCNVAGETLDSLLDSGLIENGGQGRYTIHQTISHYALLRHTDRRAEKRMVIFFVNFVQTHRENYEALERETENILAAFQLACDKQLWTELIKGINAFAPFLQSRGVYSIAETYLTQAQQAAIALGDNTNLTVTYLHLGRIADLSGDYEKAEQLYQEGLRLARTVDQRETMSLLLAYWGEMLLNQGRYPQAEQCLQEGLLLAQALDEPLRISVLFKNLGEAADSQGRYQQGKAYYQSGLHYARQASNWEIMSALLQNLGSNATRYGDYEQAETYFQEGLFYARKLGHRQRISAILMNIGLIIFKRKRYVEAEKLYQQSLDIARKMNNPLRMGCVLQNLGMLERTRNHEQAAETYLQESLEIAYKMGHAWLISETLCEWGELYLNQKKLDEACKAFEQALAKAHTMEAAELMAMSKFGLARVAFLQGNLALAYQYGTESLQLFQNMEHAEASRVAQWLQQAFS